MMPAFISATAIWLFASMVVAYLSVRWAARRTHADRAVLEDLVTSITLGALLGSRLIYAVFNPTATLRQPARLLFLKGVVSTWGTLAGGLSVLLYALWQRKLKGSNQGGFLLALASAVPPLILAWHPQGIRTTALLRIMGPIHPVAWYYAVLSAGIAALLWYRPERIAYRLALGYGVLLLFIDNFRAAPLLFHSVTSLQLVGGVLVCLSIRTPSPSY